jgi:hypothetical protein
MWIPILLGVLFAFLILWYLNRQVSYFNSGLGDRMQPQGPQEAVAPPPMDAIEGVMNQQDEYQWKRVKIEGTDALLVGVGLEQWHGESKSIMDAAQPGSMADWLRVHEMGPPAGEPQAAKEKKEEKVEDKERADSSTPWSSGGMSGGTSGSYIPSSAGGFNGGFVTTMSVPSSSPGAPPSAAQMQQQALDAWKAQQQVGADAAAQQAQQAAVQTQVNYFTTMYNVTWLPRQTVKSDTPANRSSFVTQQTQMTTTSMSTTPLSQTATRTQLYNQLQALQNMTRTWVNPPPPAPPPAPAASKKYWGPQTGIDYTGYDIGSMVANSDPDACAKLCDANTQCVGYVLATDIKGCWLKSKFANPTPSNMRTVRVKPGQPTPPPGLPPTSKLSISGANWTPFMGNDYPGSVLQFFPAKTRAQCASACTASSACKGFSTAANVTDSIAGNCVLKSAWVSSGVKPNTNLNAYHKS